VERVDQSSGRCIDSILKRELDRPSYCALLILLTTLKQTLLMVSRTDTVRCWTGNGRPYFTPARFALDGSAAPQGTHRGAPLGEQRVASPTNAEAVDVVVSGLDRPIVLDYRTTDLSQPAIVFGRDTADFADFQLRSRHPVIIEEIEYPTSEHAYHSYKFPDREVKTQMAGWAEPRWYAVHPTVRPWIRVDWAEVKYTILVYVLYLKFHQHANFVFSQLQTERHPLIDGEDYLGENELGTALEEVRKRHGERIAEERIAEIR